MEPHHPSRRRLLGGPLAGLFGWLLPIKSEAKPALRPPVPGHDTLPTLVGYPLAYSYTAPAFRGSINVSSGTLSCQGTTHFSYDGSTGRSSLPHD
jgi:hypothetical protein